ncbi:MAG: hypothetical protein JSU83_16915, partial [Deltaproteobacteria bacterium]
PWQRRHRRSQAEGYGVSSAFPKGKQNEEINKTTIILLLLVYSEVFKYFGYLVILNSYDSFFILFMHN